MINITEGWLNLKDSQLKEEKSIIVQLKGLQKLQKENVTDKSISLHFLKKLQALGRKEFKIENIDI
jgi:hypothetical protein